MIYISNSQNGVYLGYARRLGYSLVEGQLFMPEEWFTEEYADQRATCGVPKELTLQTKPEIGLSLLKRAVVRGTLPFAWVAADALYGDSPAFRDGVAALNKWYFTESDAARWFGNAAQKAICLSGRGAVVVPRACSCVNRAPRAPTNR